MQAPTPLQVEAPAHSLSGSVKLAMLPQVPFEPEPFFASEQAWQIPEQAVLQQKPSTQLPLEHSEAIVQAAPLARSPHAPAPLQVVAPEHSFAGSVPAGTLVHKPTLPVTLHA